MSENKNLTHNSKKSFLQNPVEHIDITSFDARKIISSMEKMSFVSRETANAANIFNEMIQDKDCTIFLTLAGSTSAAGCMNIYKDLVKYNMVDAIIATGASIVDMDFFEALGFKHYQGSQFQDDTELRKNYIDRIYDTYIDEDELQECDQKICEIADTLDPRSYTSREFIYEMGKYLKKNSKKKDSLIETAYDNNVPIFCPAFTDSSAGFGLVTHQENNPKNHITIDSIRELRELTEIKIQSKGSGLFMIGGGVPKEEKKVQKWKKRRCTQKGFYLHFFELKNSFIQKFFGLVARLIATVNAFVVRHIAVFVFQVRNNGERFDICSPVSLRQLFVT